MELFDIVRNVTQLNYGDHTRSTFIRLPLNDAEKIFSVSFAAVILTIGVIWTLYKGQGSTDPKSKAAAKKPASTRDIVEQLEVLEKDCVICYGSQTGTAEDYASRLAKDASTRFGLKTLVADFDNYDFDRLNELPPHKLAIFVMATYGEGEPTDNAVGFWEFITQENPEFVNPSKGSLPLSEMRCVLFGLGNSTYEHYNAMIRRLKKHFDRLGAYQIGACGEGDDGKGTMEDDFLAWKEPMWQAVAQEMGLKETEAKYEPTFDVRELEEHSSDMKSQNVYLGELSAAQLTGTVVERYDAHQPFIARVLESMELFSIQDRNCLHMEIDLRGSDLAYTTGDHIAIWPMNAGAHVQQFLQVFDLVEKQRTVIDIEPRDPAVKLPFPTPTTYETVLRYYLEICAPVSRQFFATVAQFAPSPEAKQRVSELASGPENFKTMITSKRMNVAQALYSIHPGPWPVPFVCLIEGLNRIQPRFYSISSSSAVQPNKVSITAVVESVELPDAEHVSTFKGVATNYLLALKERQHGDLNPSPHGLTYTIDGPRDAYSGFHIPVHIRYSNFRLPVDPSTPIIMIGPGTGVAPFRGFIQERAFLVGKGIDVGVSMLFYGCRNPSEDWLYKNEWTMYQDVMKEKLVIHNAFSRQTRKKVYVQHHLQEHADRVNELLLAGATFYVCGDAANMAREVHQVLEQIIIQKRSMSLSEAQAFVKGMRSSGKYQEDVWA